jgi:serine/threonine-protein kinase
LSGEFLPYLTGFRPGSMLAGYRLEALVGAGGMAVVFRARDERLDRPVALKILDPSRVKNDPALRERFIAESRAAARVDDPHIIPVYEADEADGVLFIAMRFVHSGDLRNVLEREGRLSSERAMAFISPVASALDAAHAAGLVHRDVKPANVLVDARPGRPAEVYLSDFGIAKAAVAGPALTEPGFLMGTPDYSAPEQIDGQAVDGRADQYALACLAYELLAGAPPFRRGDVVSTLGAHLHAPPPSLGDPRPDLPAAAGKVLTKAMAKAPGQRYESCGDFAEVLREALGLTPYRPRGYTSAFAPPPAPPQAPLPDPAAVPAMSSEPITVSYAADTLTDPRVPAPAAASPGSEPPLAEPDYEPPRWHEPAGPATAPPRVPAPPRRPARRRQPGLPVVRVGLPLAVLAAAMAAILVAVHAHTGTSAAVNAGNAAGPGGTACASAFSGYPGRHGSVTVSSIATAGGTRLAVGGADGQPAIWRCANGGWELVSASIAGTLDRATLSSVAHGPDGWMAIGEAGSGPGQHPVAVTSPDGVSWRLVDGPAAFTGPGSCVASIAAGQQGYAVVGKHVNGAMVFAAMWGSADARRWAQGDNDRFGTLDGRLSASTVDAVVATPSGFVAAGTHGSGGVLWTSADGGQQWTLMSGTGVRSGALLLTAVSGNRVVAAGYQATADGDIPVVVTSTDGGRHWTPPVVLQPPGGQRGGRVTALAVAGSGFIAAGRTGPVGAQQSVTWTSPDGLTWSKAHPAASGTSGVSALSATGQTVTGVQQRCLPA